MDSEICVLSCCAGLAMADGYVVVLLHWCYVFYPLPALLVLMPPTEVLRNPSPTATLRDEWEGRE